MNFELTRHIAVQVRNQKKAATFYRDVLGMELVKEKEGETEMKCGDTHFYIEEADSEKTFFEFSVEDFVAAKEKLLSEDCEITQVYAPKSAMFKDPYGMRFHIWERGGSKEEIGVCFSQ